MAQALKQLKEKKHPELSDAQIETVLSDVWVRQPKTLKAISAKALIRKFLQCPLNGKREVLALPMSVLEEMVGKLASWRRYCRFEELATYPELLETLLESGAVTSISLGIWVDDHSELEKLLAYVPLRCPRLEKVTWLDPFKVDTEPDTSIPSSWERLDKLKIMRLPRSELSAQSIRALPNLRMLECCIGKKAFGSDLVAIGSLKTLVDLRLGVSSTVPGCVAGAGLARLVGQLPGLKQIYCGSSNKSFFSHDVSSVSSHFVREVVPILQHRAENLQLLHLFVKNCHLKYISFPSKLELKTIYLVGPLEEKAMWALHGANADHLKKLCIQNVQPTALYDVMQYLGPNLKNFVFKTDREDLIEPLQLHKVLAPAPNLEKLSFETDYIWLANPLPHELEMICGKSLRSFFAEPDSYGQQFDDEQKYIIAKYLKVYLKQTNSASILEDVYTDWITPTLEALQDDPLCCSRVNNVKLHLCGRKHLIGPAAELSFLLATRSPSLKSIEWCALDSFVEGRDTVCAELKENHKWFLHFLCESGLSLELIE